MPIIKIELEIEQEELEEFIHENGNLHDWIFGEICQNHGLGFLSNLAVFPDDDKEEK